MKNLSFIVPAILSSVHMGCKSNQPDKQKPLSEVCYSVEHPSKLEGAETGEMQIRSAKREGDCLYLEVAYSACGNEPLYLLWNGMLMKSLPPKASVKPVFVYGEARCRLLIEKTVCFSIKSLRDNTRNTGLVLLIEGYEPPVEIPAEK
jgi:hypothetical protein